MLIDARGWIEGVRQCPSPNCDARPQGVAVDLLVIHNISLPPGEFGSGLIEALFTNTLANTLDTAAHPALSDLDGLRVSAHLLIARDGEVTQFVPFEERAWHAGVSRFEGREACNDFSIGIELEGTDHTPYTPAQYRCLAAISRLLQRRYTGLTADRIVGHCDVAPGRKTDPGPAFDWNRYRELMAQS